MPLWDGRRVQKSSGFSRFDFIPHMSMGNVLRAAWQYLLPVSSEAYFVIPDEIICNSPMPETPTWI